MKLERSKTQIALAKACMNPSDLCRIAKIQYQTFYNVINGGESKPKTIGRIAAALGVDVETIIDFEREVKN